MSDSEPIEPGRAWYTADHEELRTAGQRHRADTENVPTVIRIVHDECTLTVAVSEILLHVGVFQFLG